MPEGQLKLTCFYISVKVGVVTCWLLKSVLNVIRLSFSVFLIYWLHNHHSFYLVGCKSRLHGRQVNN